jgi:NitT/TauT family transport system ATP-binding protein
MSIERTVQPAPLATSEPLVVFDSVSKTYDIRGEALRALANVTFTVEHGQFVSLLGHSGCGKSTLLKMAAGLTPISSGAIRIGGESVQGPVGGLGMVFQSPVLLEWRDVIGNVKLPLEILGLNGPEGQEQAARLIEMVGLAGFERRYASELSGGMQQRVAICRALVTDPSVLLMDEPFGALDALTRDIMAAELLRIWNETQKTILFVTHSIDEAVLLSDRVVVLTPRPGSVGLILDINLPRPRSAEIRYDPRFIELSQQLREAIYQGLYTTTAGATASTGVEAADGASWRGITPT